METEDAEAAPMLSRACPFWVSFQLWAVTFTALLLRAVIAFPWLVTVPVRPVIRSPWPATVVPRVETVEPREVTVPESVESPCESAAS